MHILTWCLRTYLCNEEDPRRAPAPNNQSSALLIRIWICSRKNFLIQLKLTCPRASNYSSSNLCEKSRQKTSMTSANAGVKQRATWKGNGFSKIILLLILLFRFQVNHKNVVCPWYLGSTWVECPQIHEISSPSDAAMALAWHVAQQLVSPQSHLYAILNSCFLKHPYIFRL
jgi:hypothetical protein